MSTIHELGQALRMRRAEMGLSQAQVAALSGLSRQTVNQVETGVVPDLGLNKAERLAAVLGLALRVDLGRAAPIRARRTMTPLARAAASASVSYRTPIAGATLKKVLASGQVPAKYLPHLHALLDDAPVSLLAAVADQLHDESKIDREAVWKTYRSLAREVQSKRGLWQ
jgi:transcriptional regulator with XRE-family HTH domain